MSLRSKISLWTVLLSIMPLLVLYWSLSEMLTSTRTLIAKEAGDYGERRAHLMNKKNQREFQDTLRENLESMATLWSELRKAELEPEQLTALFREAIKDKAALLFFFDKEGNFHEASNEEWVTTAARGQPVLEQELRRGYYLATTQIESDSYTMMLALPRAERTRTHSTARHFLDEFTADVEANVNAAISNLRLVAFSFFMALGLMGLVMSRWLTKIISKPVEELAAAMAEFDGTIPVPIASDRSDEIGLLINRFSEMTHKLVETSGQLERTDSALQAADRELMELNQNLEARIIERTAELEMALGKLRELDQHKDDFLGLVSHELKTPLTSIQASAEALLTEDLGISKEGKVRFLQIISREALRLTRLIDELLDLTGLEAKRLPFRFEETNLIELVKQTVEAHRLAIHQKGLSLEMNINEDERLGRAILDADRMIQIITNLLSNAIKYTERGRISVLLALVEIGSAPMAQLVVADTGVGIRPEDAHKVFDRFQQIEHLTMHSEGLGLGLPISKMLVESMGGDIHFASKPQQGTAFTVVLPLDARRSLAAQKIGEV